MWASNDYSETMFRPEKMRAVMAELARVLPGLMKEHQFDTIAVTGKSGAALGFALTMYVPGLHVVYIRKGESSHGYQIEGDGHEFSKYALLDDFISSGATARRVKRELEDHAHGHGLTSNDPEDWPELVFVIQYSGYRETAVTEKAHIYEDGAPTLHVPAIRLPAAEYLPAAAAHFLPQGEVT